MRGLRRNLAALSSLLVIFHGGVSVVEAISLTRDQRTDIDAFHHDPIADIVLNYTLAGVSVLCGLAMLVSRRTWAINAATLAVFVGGVEAVWLVASAFGGIPYLGLLLVRGLIVIVLALMEVRDQFW